MDQEFFTPAEIAERLRVAESTVYKWIADRKLRAARFGRAKRISRTALEEFIQRAETEGIGEGDKSQ